MKIRELKHSVVLYTDLSEWLESYIGCISKVRLSFPERTYTVGLTHCVKLPTHKQFQILGKHVLITLTRKYRYNAQTCIGHITRARKFLKWLEKRLSDWTETLSEDNVKLIFHDYITSLRNRTRASEHQQGNKQAVLLQFTTKLILDSFLELDGSYLMDGTYLIQTNQSGVNSYIPPTVEDAEKAFRFYLTQFNNWFLKEEDNLHPTSKDIRKLKFYFYYLLQALTGMSISQMQQIEISALVSASRLSNEHHDPRIKVVKARAGNIEQEFEYPLWFDREVVSQFLRTIEQYSKHTVYLRDFDTPEQEIDWSYMTYHDLSSRISSRNNIPYIRSSEWRKFKGHFLSKKYGHTVSALLLQHAEETAHKHYRTINEIEAQAEMGAFFRFQEDLHNLIESDSMKKSKTDVPAGGCDADSADERPESHIKGKQSFYIGDCKTPAGCLFCIHYVVHAEPDDFWKLESLRSYIGELALRQNNIHHIEEIHGTILSRLDEILRTLSEKPNGSKFWEEAKNKVTHKNLHPVWKRLLTTQIKLGRLDQ